MLLTIYLWAGVIMGKRQALETLDEITDILEKISEHGNHLEFCQTIGQTTHRSLSVIKNINGFSNDIAIRPKNKLNQFQFDPDVPLFAKNEFDSVVFKCDIKKLNHRNLIVANIPDLLYLLNTRSSNRYNFEELSLPVIYKNDSIINYQRKHLFFEGLLIDISENGLSFTTYSDIAIEYKWGDLIHFSTINGYSLSQKITGRIAYMKNFKLSNGQVKTKLAVKFDRIIPIKQILKYIDNQIYINA